MRISDWSSDVCSSDLQFGPNFLGCLRQGRIAGGLDERQTHGKCVELFKGKRHRRQVKAWSQQISYSRLSFDRQPGPLQMGNVAIHRADTDFEICCEILSPADPAHAQFMNQRSEEHT